LFPHVETNCGHKPNTVFQPVSEYASRELPAMLEWKINRNHHQEMNATSDSKAINSGHKNT